MQSRKENRKAPPPSESGNFKNALSEIFSHVGLDYDDAYWLTVNRPWTNPADEISYHLIYKNKSLAFNISIFDLKTYFVNWDIISNNGGKSFSSFHFCEVTGFPVFAFQGLRGEEYLLHYLEYLKSLLKGTVFIDVLTGHFWFDFSFDMRDWATSPGLISGIRARFLEGRKSMKSE